MSLLVSLMPAVAILLYTPPTAIQAGSTTTISLPAPETAHLLQEKIGEALLAEMANAAPGDTFRFVVHLTESADLSAKSLPAARSERRKAVVEWLQQTATVSQAALIQRLETLQAAGSVVTYRPFWIINGVAASGTASAIYELAARSDVARLVLDEQRRYFEPPTKMHKLVLAPQYAAPAAGTLSWGLRRIRAPHVWHGLGVDGSGVTVAIVDTGVDWLHPDLNGNYRGNLGNGNVEHAGNWYHAAYPTMTVPFDHIGHGTHVAGTAVGQNGIGVAPGAQWIAVSIAGAGGLIYDSQVHAAFEWLLAPNGKPTLAPDVVNNSWGGPGWYDAFVGDITALQAAGMIMVFAAGNSGPEAGTVNAPASYPDTLAVGASDDIDAVAWFSSRGPSPLTTELKPLLVAPGTNILSALPDNNYGYVNGTSMATPHVAGSIALLLSADPDLSRQDITGLLLDTTVPVSSTHPNNDTGWGLLDTYLAASHQAQHGTLRGTIQSNGVPIPGVTLTVT
ncbi:MAG TPA: S8 family serine peptidase, partial [Anaerolineae bacterium]